MIDISEVNVGDRVKLTRGNGDEATFTVKNTSYGANGVIRSNSNRFDADDWDTIEIVERAFKPVPGLYSHVKDDHRVALLPDGRAYFADARGSWIPANIHREYTETYKAARELGDWEREITF